MVRPAHKMDRLTDESTHDSGCPTWNRLVVVALDRDVLAASFWRNRLRGLLGTAFNTSHRVLNPSFCHSRLRNHALPELRRE
jgi:hypothetical protein